MSSFTNALASGSAALRRLSVSGLVAGLLVAGLLGAAAPPFAGAALAQQTAQESAQGQAAKQYANEALDNEAVRLQGQLAKRISQTQRKTPAGQLLAEGLAFLRDDNPVAAVPALSAAAVVAPGDMTAWYQLARANILAARKNPNARWTYLNDATAAAYIAYQKAGNAAAEARALVIIGDSYGNRGQWRPALDSYKNSLALNEDAGVRKLYEQFRARYGFRITGYNVDSDSLRPRVCFRFSEALAAGDANFTPYVAIAGAANAAIVRDDSNNLCVEGLRHGQRYSIVLRQGLPSRVGESLLKNADYEIFVRDRSPQVRFTGKNYVLPNVGQEGIPVVSTNTDKVALDIIRVGDRSLLQTVRSDDFLAQIGTYRAKELLQNQGVKVWTGSLAVQPKLNEDVTTAIPVLDAVKKLEPGVYVALAVAGDKPVSKRIGDNDDYIDSIATQWFVVSDLGLTAFSGKDGVHVLLRSLAGAQPLAEVEVRLVARNNEVLGVLKTDARGYAKFAPGLARGAGGQAPGLIVANSGSDYNFLDLTQSAFDLSDRGVKGRPAPEPLDAFVYTERGVYRSGETVNLTALLRNAGGATVDAMPLTVVVRRPDGVEYKRMQVSDQGLGGRAASIALLSSVPTGTWRAQIFADPRSPAIGETTFLVEDYVPERLELTLAPAVKSVKQGESVRIDATARFLYGAPGSNLLVNGEFYLRLAGNSQVAGWPGYRSGLSDQEFEPVRQEIETTVRTDAQGKASVEVEIPSVSTNRPVEARFVIRAAEPGGRAVERVVALPVQPDKALIAVKEAFENLREGSSATFNVIALDPDGKRIAAQGLRWSLYRVRNSYQWYFSEGRWKFERVKSSQRVQEGRVDVGADGFARIAMPVNWGAYRLDIESGDGALAPVSVGFNVGWSGDVSANTPDLLDVTLDKKDYSQGESLNLRVYSRFAGRATVAIVGNGVHSLQQADLQEGDNRISVPVAADWGASAYAVVFAHRPLDTQAKRMPGRALGLVAFSVDNDKRKLDVAIGTPDKTQPRSTIRIPVRIGGLTPGEEAYVTVAAVDVGILNLTQFKTPDPAPYFFGQRQLSAEIRDLYGLLIDGMQGTRGAIRSGGDAAGPGMEGNRPTQEPLSRFSGVVKVGADGVANVEFDLPAFNGTARIMAVAWSKSRVGSAEKDLIIRDPVVVQATLPRLLNYGDASRFHIRIDNVDGEPGEYAVEFDINGPVAIAASALRREFTLAAKQRTEFTVPVSANGVGAADISMRLTGPGVDARQTFALRIAPGTSTLYRRTVRNLAPGEAITISRDLVTDFLPGTGAISVAASAYAGIDAPSLLQALDRYPYGCSEQIVSRALPLLYVARLAPAGQLALDGNVGERVQKAIDQVMARQDSAGRFGLWSADGSSDLWLDSFIADFLTRAREAGYSVPQRGFDQALDWLRNKVANTTDVNARNGTEIAYAVYVLARNGRPVMGDLRYLVESKLDQFATPLARAQIGAALALLGDRSRAMRAFESAAAALSTAKASKYSRADYGSLLRDSAGFLALAAEANAGSTLIVQAAQKIQETRSAIAYTSTQENAWMVLAAASLAGGAKDMALTIDGQAHSGSYFRTWRNGSLDGEPVRIANTSQAPVQVVLTTSGYPVTREPPAANGYRIERNYFTLDGKPADLARLKQNDRLVAVLKVTETEAAYARLLLVDLLPAGLEIDNPKLVDSGSVASLPWLKSNVAPAHTEYRDDRFVAAFNRTGRDKAIFYAAYIVRAVTPGRYVHPPATVEDMYRPDRFGRTAFGAATVASPQ